MSNLTDLINSTRIQDRFSNPYNFISELQDAWTWQKDFADASGVMAGVNMAMKSMALQNRYADLNNNLFATITKIQNNPALQFNNTLFDSLTRINAYQQSVNKIFGAYQFPFSKNYSPSIADLRNEFNSTIDAIKEEVTETVDGVLMQHIAYVAVGINNFLDNIRNKINMDIVYIKIATVIKYIDEQISSISLKDFLLIAIAILCERLNNQ